MLTKQQIQYAARFWTDKLKLLVDEKSATKFEIGLKTYLSGKDGEDVAAICCKQRPESTLEMVIKKVCLPTTLFQINVEMLFNVDGTVEIWQNGNWEKIEP